MCNPRKHFIFFLEYASWSKVTEAYKLKERFFNSSLKTINVLSNVSHSKTYSNIVSARRVYALFFRMKLNAFITKFSKGVKCLCGQRITSFHIVFQCRRVKHFLPSFSEHSLESIFKNFELACQIAKTLLHSPMGHLL